MENKEVREKRENSYGEEVEELKELEKVKKEISVWDMIINEIKEPQIIKEM